MNNETRGEVLSVIDGLNDKETKEDVRNIQRLNPVDILRISVFDFFKSRLHTIEKDEELKKAVENKLLEKIANNELNVAQLISLARGLRNDTTMAVDSLLSILKPVPNTTNPLMDRTGDDSDEKRLLEAFGNMSNEDSNAIEYLTRIVREERERKLKEKETTDVQFRVEN